MDLTFVIKYKYANPHTSLDLHRLEGIGGKQYNKSETKKQYNKSETKKRYNKSETKKQYNKSKTKKTIQQK